MSALLSLKPIVEERLPVNNILTPFHSRAPTASQAIITVAQQRFSAYGGDSSRGGSGLGNVENKMLPSSDHTKSLFPHCKYPRTTSVIG